MRDHSKLIPIFLCSLLFGYSIFAAYSRGGDDFNVFYAAWKMAWNGGAQDVYHATPDRFLYAPGFAWALAPLGALPRDVALPMWNALKIIALGLVLLRLDPLRLGESNGLGRSGDQLGGRLEGMSIGAWGVLLFARPVMIDIQYGQVNILFMCICFLALQSLFEGGVRERTGKRGGLLELLQSIWWDRRRLVLWFLAGFGALTKVMTLPLLVPPMLCFLRAKPSERLRWAIPLLGIVLGFFVALFLPVVSVGLDGTLRFWRDWVMAVQARGLPLETHNQSVVAIVAHLFFRDPIPAVALGGWRVYFGLPFLEPRAIITVGWVWFGLAAVVLLMTMTLGFPLRASESDSRGALFPRLKAWRWCALILAMTIMPSHLIWKPYLVFGIPAAILAVHEARAELAIGRWRSLIFLVAIGGLVNLTSISVIGFEFGLWCEAAGVLLWGLIALIVWHWRRLYFANLSSSSPL